MTLHHAQKHSLKIIPLLFLSFPSPSFFLTGLAALLLKTPWSQDNKMPCHAPWSQQSGRSRNPSGPPHPCHLHSRPAVLAAITGQATVSWKPLAHLKTGTCVSFLGHSLSTIFTQSAVFPHTFCTLPKGPSISPAPAHSGKNLTTAL